MLCACSEIGPTMENDVMTDQPAHQTTRKPMPSPKDRPKFVLAKRQKGRDAFKNRQPLSANPCRMWNEQQEWAWGWIEMRDALVDDYLAGKVKIND